MSFSTPISLLRRSGALAAAARRTMAPAPLAISHRRFFSAATGGVTEVDANGFEKAITTSNTPVLVDFYATWCGPCRMLAPVLDKVAQTHTDKLKVIKLDTDEAAHVAAKHGVAALPTVVLFKGGKEVDRFMGVRPEAQVLAFVKQHLD